MRKSYKLLLKNPLNFTNNIYMMRPNNETVILRADRGISANCDLFTEFKEIVL